MNKDTDHKDTNDDDAVGYKHPPKRGRFKKGCSGNPKGRPKFDFKTMGEQFLTEFNAKIEVNDGGKRCKMTKLEVAIKRLINNALNGDPKAWFILMRVIPDMEKKLPPRKVTQKVVVSWLRDGEDEKKEDD